jgi:tripartite-type tricarboxylate transporter receptor subunit TctC
MKQFTLIAACLLAMAALLTLPAGAAGYPDRPITLLVGFAPGGSMDLSARALAAAAEKVLGQPIAVENKTGGTGSVALAALLNAKPDGYTLVATPSSVLIRVSQMQAFPFKPLKDFKPIIGFGTPELGIVVKSDAPWKTLPELAGYAKENPGGIKFATTGNGSTTHGAVEEMIIKDDLQMIHVPYKGSIEAITALLGGHVEMASVTSEFIPSVQAGQTRLLATMGESRAEKFADVPTMKEAGYQFINETVYSLIAPAALPADIARQLEEAFAKAGESKECREAFDKIDLTPVHYDGKAFEQFLKASWQKVNKQLLQAGLIKEAATQPE